MKSVEVVSRARELRREGATYAAIAAVLDVHPSTVGGWLRRGDDVIARRTRRSSSCTDVCVARAELPAREYAYLFGQYLGDGWLNPKFPRGVQRLTISCSTIYPAIVEECRDAMAATMPDNRVAVRARSGVTEVSCYSTHWRCLLPQAGPGLKHTRPIVLRPWQEEIVLVQHPGPFVRGLVHSDGWRGDNGVRGANGKRYVYSRYQFSNRSSDIRQLFVRGCAALGVETKRMNAWNISVNTRASVAILDRWVGPKR